MKNEGRMESDESNEISIFDPPWTSIKQMIEFTNIADWLTDKPLLDCLSSLKLLTSDRLISVSYSELNCLNITDDIWYLKSKGESPSLNNWKTQLWKRASVPALMTLLLRRRCLYGGVCFVAVFCCIVLMIIRSHIDQMLIWVLLRNALISEWSIALRGSFCLVIR